jgi:hypothetical protein
MQRVHPLGPVEGYVRDMVALLVFDEFQVHAASPRFAFTG